MLLYFDITFNIGYDCQLGLFVDEYSFQMSDMWILTTT